MKRRRYIAAAAAGATAAVAGCGGVLGSDEGSPDDTIEEFYAAVESGDLEEANTFVHGDSPEGNLSEDDLPEREAREYKVDETEVLEQDDTTARVRYVLIVVAENPITGDPVEHESEGTVELRRADGEWKLYETVDGEFGEDAVPDDVPAVETESLEDAVEQVNRMIEDINENEDNSLKVYNENIGDQEPVEYIDPVEAETEREAQEEAERLREEIERLRRDILERVIEKTNNQSEVDIFEQADVDRELLYTVDGAKKVADSIEEHSAVAADNILLAVDFAELIEQLLEIAAHLLENAEAA